MPIHPTAVIDPRAELHETVEVGPYVVIERGVRVGAGTRIMAHAYLNGETTIGENNIIHMGAVIGHEPQDLGYDGSPRSVIVGDRNVIREHATIHRATSPDAPTRLGDDCYMMVGSHIGHDSVVGNRVILANNVLIAGHVEVQDGANISGGCPVHQFTRIGRFSMMRGLSTLSKDLPPFMMSMSVNRICGLNVIGLRRAGFSAAARKAIKQAYKIMYREGNSAPVALEKLKAGEPTPEVQEIIDFMESTKRGICWRSSDED